MCNNKIHPLSGHSGISNQTQPHLELVVVGIQALAKVSTATTLPVWWPWVKRIS
jgi:hypothetical protein